MALIAYELREDYRGTVTQSIDGQDVEVPVFTGGLVHVGTVGREANIAELVAGREDGIVVIDDEDTELAVALDAYPALKRAKVPDGAVAVNTPADYADQRVGELRAEASSRGIEGTSGANKDELVTALEEHDRRLADDSLDELGAPLTVKALAGGSPAEGEPVAAAGATGEGA